MKLVKPQYGNANQIGLDELIKINHQGKSSDIFLS